MRPRPSARRRATPATPGQTERPRAAVPLGDLVLDLAAGAALRGQVLCPAGKLLNHEGL